MGIAAALQTEAFTLAHLVRPARSHSTVRSLLQAMIAVLVAVQVLDLHKVINVMQNLGQHKHSVNCLANSS